MEKLSEDKLEEIYLQLEREILAIKNSICEPLKLRKSTIEKLLQMIIGRCKISEYLDFEGVSFDGVNVECTDFSTLQNVDLDPQTVANKSLYGAYLYGDFKGKSFDGVNVECADFTLATNVEDEFYNELAYISGYFKEYKNSLSQKNK